MAVRVNALAAWTLRRLALSDVLGPVAASQEKTHGS